MTTREPAHGGRDERVAALADALAAQSDASTPYTPPTGLCVLIDAALGGEPVEKVFGSVSDVGIDTPEYHGAVIVLTTRLAAWVRWFPPTIQKNVDITTVPRSGFRAIFFEERMSKLKRGKLPTELTLILSHDSLIRVEVPVPRDDVADAVSTLLGGA